MNTAFLPCFAATAFISALLGMAFNRLELASFGIAVSALVLLIAATDYAPRRRYSRVACLASPRAERHPLAA